LNYKYNEELYGKTIYKKGFQTNYIKSELTILVKYLKQIENKNKKETEKILYEFCKKHIEGFNNIQYFKVIDSAIRNGRKKNNRLITIKSIPLYKKEIEYIDKLSLNHEYKKLLLSFLVNKRISHEVRKIHDSKCNELSVYFGGSNRKYRDVIKSANLVDKYKIDDMIYELVNSNIIASIINGDIVLEFMYKIYGYESEYVTIKDEVVEKKKIIFNPNNYEIYEELTNFENIGYIFDFYKGVNNVKKCGKCGTYIKSNNNKHKYCKLCAKETNIEKTKENRNKKCLK
jgi:hypothetical protein